jgi:hypothetical protein
MNGSSFDSSAWDPTRAPNHVQTPVQPKQEWSPVATDGNLFLSRSALEFAVYDRQHNYGRWPLTDEGYYYACQTYEAHRQSRAHGMAYTATGYQDPIRLGLPTQPAVKSQSYGAPLSYIGGTRRILAWATATEQRSPTLTTLVWVGAVLAMVVLWAFLVFWYFFIFGLFGVFVIPYRLVRRSQRKSVHIQQTSLATQQAMLQQVAAQQQAILQHQAIVQGQQQAAYPAPQQLPGAPRPLPPPQPYE